MRKLFGAATLVILAGQLTGCGAGARSEGIVTAQIDTVAGVERWHYPGSDGPTLRAKIDTIALIGGAEVDDDAYHFNQVVGIGLEGDAAGNLYVLDRMGRRVLKYDSQGRHLGTFGRGGTGPGELGSPIGVAIGPGDSIWVADLTNGRFVIYPQDGGESRSVVVAAGGLIMPGAGFTFRGDVALHDFRQRALPGMGGPRPAGGPPQLPQEPPRVIVRMGTDGVASDTLWVKEVPQPEVKQTGGGDRVMVVMMQRTFEPALHWAAFADGGIALADSAEYIIHLVDADGRIRRRIDRDLPAREVTEADKEAARERLRERAQSGGGVRVSVTSGSGGTQTTATTGSFAMTQAQLDAMTFAPVIPRITGIRIDQADRIWVGVSVDNPEETDRIDIYDREGRLLTQLFGHALPTTFFGADLAARVVKDDYDVEQILIYRSPFTGETMGSGE